MVDQNIRITELPTGVRQYEVKCPLFVREKLLVLPKAEWKQCASAVGLHMDDYDLLYQLFREPCIFAITIVDRRTMQVAYTTDNSLNVFVVLTVVHNLRKRLAGGPGTTSLLFRRIDPDPPMVAS